MHEVLRRFDEILNKKCGKEQIDMLAERIDNECSRKEELIRIQDKSILMN